MLLDQLNNIKHKSWRNSNRNRTIWKQKRIKIHRDANKPEKPVWL